MVITVTIYIVTLPPLSGCHVLGAGSKLQLFDRAL